MPGLGWASLSDKAISPSFFPLFSCAAAVNEVCNYTPPLSTGFFVRRKSSKKLGVPREFMGKIIYFMPFTCNSFEETNKLVERNL